MLRRLKEGVGAVARLRDLATSCVTSISISVRPASTMSRSSVAQTLRYMHSPETHVIVVWHDEGLDSRFG
jgi:hypothetical protein